MTKVFKADGMDYTPFVKAVGALKGQGIEFTESEEDCDVFVARIFNYLEPFIQKYGQTKKYLIWTHEPRYNVSFERKIFSHGVEVHIMNAYTEDIYMDNYSFYGWSIVAGLHEPLQYMSEKGFYREKCRKIAALMTNFQSTPATPGTVSLVRGGHNIDLYSMRADIALRGHELGVVDVYGKGWRDGISLEDSRSGEWQNRKESLLEKYHFNLCFENTIIDFYCTEKIWHSIRFGCLPIYYGGVGSTIYKDFDANSFLDYTAFDNPDEMFDYVREMTIDEYNQRMNLCIDAFNNAYSKLKKASPNRVINNITARIKEIVTL